MREIRFKKADTVKVIAELASLIDSFPEEKEYIITVKEFKEKRSISANNYFWTLVDKLAEKLLIEKTEIYRSYIKEIGGNNYLVCCTNNAVSDLCKDWSERGTGWIYELEDSKLPGCTNVRLYYGSSNYNTTQMSRLIDMAVQDCKEQDIPTYSQEELQKLCDEWGLRYEGRL